MSCEQRPASSSGSAFFLRAVNEWPCLTNPSATSPSEECLDVHKSDAKVVNGHRKSIG